MKKQLALSLALVMVLSLAACGGKTDPAPSGGGTTDPGTQQTDPGTSQQEQTSQPEESDTEKTGNEASEWPDNVFTKTVPEPTFQVASVSGSEDSGMFTVGFSGVSYDEIKEYAEQVKAEGFEDGTIIEDSSTGFYWQSKSSDGSMGIDVEWKENGEASIFFTKM